VDLLYQAFQNIIQFEKNYLEIIILSLYISIVATFLSSIISILVASYIAMNRFIGKSFLIILINTLMSLPPVVVGLILYIVFSASGIFGSINILYSPTIMIIAQFIIITPIIISLSLKSFIDRFNLLKEYLITLNTAKNKIRNTIIYESRYDLLIIIITGMSRALSEVGAVIIVGGNIDHLTRVMTTSIVLETSRGELSLALSLGISLILIALIMNLAILTVKKRVL
tara:strand:- start:1584 stop:2264 length:681 start_codon:yes stop_codon:yes gene_type:complete